jgi:MFS transporter, ACS family, pantothenate transporter
MMTMGFCFQIWVPLLTFPAVEAPRWSNGYPAAVAFETAMWAFLMVGYWYMRRYKSKNPDLEMRLEAEQREKQVAAATPRQSGSIDARVTPSAAKGTPVATELKI